MIQRLIFALAACVVMSSAMAQTLPQFSSDSFEGWVYNNPGVELSTTNIGGGRIVLYTSANTGLTLTLISPEFSCQGIDTISSVVTWYTKGATTSGFDLSRAALTLAIDDVEGNPLDSMTVTPTTPGVSTHMLEFSIPVPPGLTAARLRFVSWQGVVASCGAVRNATFTAITSSPQSLHPGDVDGNGTVSIADVTALIDYLLGASSPVEVANADIDSDGVVNINDVTLLIDKLLSGN